MANEHATSTSLRVGKAGAPFLPSAYRSALDTIVLGSVGGDGFSRVGEGGFVSVARVCVSTCARQLAVGDIGENHPQTWVQRLSSAQPPPCKPRLQHVHPLGERYATLFRCSATALFVITYIYVLLASGNIAGRWRSMHRHLYRAALTFSAVVTLQPIQLRSLST